MKMSEVLEHNAARRRGKLAAKPKLKRVSIEEAENGGHVVEHHFESNGPEYHEPKTHAFAAPEGKPQIPAGHVLAHVAKAMNIPHEVVGTAEKDEDGDYDGD